MCSETTLALSPKRFLPSFRTTRRMMYRPHIGLPTLRCVFLVRTFRIILVCIVFSFDTFPLAIKQNSFENNVAAGSEGTGFWFELRTSAYHSEAVVYVVHVFIFQPSPVILYVFYARCDVIGVRGPSASLHPGVNPSKLPLKSFVGNVAHSNMGAGLATYPGTSYSIKHHTFDILQVCCAQTLPFHSTSLAGYRRRL